MDNQCWLMILTVVLVIVAYGVWQNTMRFANLQKTVDKAMAVLKELGGDLRDDVVKLSQRLRAAFQRGEEALREELRAVVNELQQKSNSVLTKLNDLYQTVKSSVSSAKEEFMNRLENLQQKFVETQQKIRELSKTIFEIGQKSLQSLINTLTQIQQRLADDEKSLNDAYQMICQSGSDNPAVTPTGPPYCPYLTSVTTITGG